MDPKEEHPKEEHSHEAPKPKQLVKTIGRTIYCFVCDESDGKLMKEIAAYYCPCGSFLCAMHFVDHKCLILHNLDYNEDILQALQ